MAKRSTRTMGETVACRRLIACLPGSSINRRPRKSEIRWSGFENYIKPNRKKRYKVYIHHLKNSINHSVHPLAEGKGKEEKRTRPRDLRARCALCKPRSEIIPREGNFTACYYLQQGKTRTNNQIADSEQEFEMYEPGPGENELQARRKD